jgi:excisionase family DNA binding protein
MTKGNSRISTKDARRLLDRPTVTVEEAAQILGLSRNPTYDAVRNKQIPSIRVGRSLKVPSAWLRRMLDLPAAVEGAK